MTARVEAVGVRGSPINIGNYYSAYVLIRTDTAEELAKEGETKTRTYAKNAFLFPVVGGFASLSPGHPHAEMAT